MTLVLGLLLMGLGIWVAVAAVRKRKRVPQSRLSDTVGTVIGGVLVFVVGFSVMGFGFASESTEPLAAAPVAPSPAVTAPSGRTDLQNLAIIANVSEHDADLNRQYSRLQTLCPPANVSVADLVVNLQQMVRNESGRDMPLTEVMRQLATAQEGGAEMGMTCTETGSMLAELLIKGM